MHQYLRTYGIRGRNVFTQLVECGYIHGVTVQLGPAVGVGSGQEAHSVDGELHLRAAAHPETTDILSVRPTFHRPVEGVDI